MSDGLDPAFLCGAIFAWLVAAVVLYLFPVPPIPELTFVFASGMALLVLLFGGTSADPAEDTKELSDSAEK